MTEGEQSNKADAISLMVAMTMKYGTCEQGGCSGDTTYTLIKFFAALEFNISRSCLKVMHKMCH